jgi:hypothetical protein
MLKSIMQERWKSTLNTLMLILMAALKLEAENAVIAQMNKWEFRQRYEALCSFKIEKNIFKSVIPYLEKAMEVDPKMQTWLIHF